MGRGGHIGGGRHDRNNSGGGGARGGSGNNTTPLCTSASAVVTVLYSPTNMVVFTHTKSCAAPVILFVWVLPVSVPSFPVRVSSIGSPISASDKLSFPRKVKVDPANPEVADHVPPTISLQGRV